MIVEIVDGREKLKTFLQRIDPAITGGLATLEKAEVRFYRGGGIKSD
jgi:PII-like signaling protein